MLDWLSHVGTKSSLWLHAPWHSQENGRSEYLKIFREMQWKQWKSEQNTSLSSHAVSIAKHNVSLTKRVNITGSQTLASVRQFWCCCLSDVSKYFRFLLIPFSSNMDGEDCVNLWNLPMPFPSPFSVPKQPSMSISWNTTITWSNISFRVKIIQSLVIARVCSIWMTESHFTGCWTCTVKLCCFHLTCLCWLSDSHWHVFSIVRAVSCCLHWQRYQISPGFVGSWWMPLRSFCVYRKALVSTA